MTEERKKWYVLRAVSGKENKVKEYLESEMKKNRFRKVRFSSSHPPHRKDLYNTQRKESDERTRLSSRIRAY